jgi:magnesium-transporting ATPase (P-type)
METNGEKLGLNNDHILLRGMTLRNTPSVVGCVIYTGHDTKI